MGGGPATLSKGAVKSLSNLLAAVVHDCARECHTDPAADIKKMSQRFEEEGIAFLAITLPVLAEALEQGLRHGRLDLTALTGFARKGGLPLMLGGFLRQVFDSKGRLLDVPSIAAISSIRQICLMWKKIQLPCSQERMNAAIEAYIQAEREIPDADIFSQEHYALREAFRFVSRVIWSEVLSDVNQLAVDRSFIPRHGPGTTSEKIRGNAKYLPQKWPERLDQYFPLDQFGVLNAEWVLDSSGYPYSSLLSPGDEIPVRVIFVPKTLKGPRVIAAEPIVMQYAQQAILHPLVSSIESHQLTGGHVGFSDQTVNQTLALESSKSGRNATLDLKEASDRVPLWGVELMLECVPDFLGALLACRSTRALTPSGEEVRLRKFASMGSATCFPIEAMFFYTVMISGLLISRRLPWRRSSIFSISRDVYVYGDDIIVPVDEVDSVVDSLEAFGLKVNTRKSFWTGKFRESCGMDAYDGVRVTPVYVRRLCPTTLADAQSVLSWVSLGNQLYQAGLWGAAKSCRSLVEHITGELPMVHSQSGCLGWHNVRNTMSVEGWCNLLHRFMVKTYQVRTVWRDDQLSGHSALLKCLLPERGNSEPSTLGHLFPKGSDVRHLERSVRSVALSTKRRWASPA